MELLQEYWIHWLGSNVIAVIILIAGLRKPKLARLLFVLLFAWACWINYTTAHNHPEDYLNYASMTPFAWMSDFIDRWFREHITTMVTAISVGQGLISLGLLLHGWWARIAGIGAIVFLCAILPLGIGSGFPASLIAAVAMYFVLKRDSLDYLWKF